MRFGSFQEQNLPFDSVLAGFFAGREEKTASVVCRPHGVETVGFWRRLKRPRDRLLWF